MKAKLIPTPLPKTAAARQPLELQRVEKRAFRTLQVVWSIVTFLWSIFWLKVRGKLSVETFAVCLRDRLESLGFLWVKAGQLLSLHTEMLPERVCDELAKLQYKAVGFDSTVSRQVIEKELGAPIAALFDDFEPTPFAAASICQVHRAKLRGSGERVAVKVQRPWIAEVFARDFGFLAFIVRLINWFGIQPFLKWSEGLAQLRQVMREETDFRFEAANLKRMRRSLKAHRIYVPRVYSQYSTARVVVMEYVEGAVLSEFIAAKKQDPAATRAWLNENEISPEKAGSRLFLSFLRQLFEDNLFHGDLHPGNIMLLRNSRLALIDFGTIGRMEPEWLGFYFKSMTALAQGEYSKTVDYTFRLCPGIPPQADLAAIKERMIDAYLAWEKDASLSDLSYRKKSLANPGREIGKVWFENEMTMSWLLLRMNRTWATMDASLNELIKDGQTASLLRKYFRQRQKRVMTAMTQPESIQAVCVRWLERKVTGDPSDDPARDPAQLSFQTARPVSREVGLLVASGLRALAWLAVVALAVLLIVKRVRPGLTLGHGEVMPALLAHTPTLGPVGFLVFSLIAVVTLRYIGRACTALRRKTHVAAAT